MLFRDVLGVVRFNPITDSRRGQSRKKNLLSSLTREVRHNRIREVSSVRGNDVFNWEKRARIFLCPPARVFRPKREHAHEISRDYLALVMKSEINCLG